MVIISYYEQLMQREPTDQNMRCEREGKIQKKNIEQRQSRNNAFGYYYAMLQDHKLEKDEHI